ncbi:unnamed protein product [Soboliphyme baturini]|uniref:Protein MEMO1 n=1 Tax=Soboliphyme baturini TaxID=241478 RepID=A0A183IKT6_9BILA|nr:unnamed protein product [Soboliphyme baturini]
MLNGSVSVRPATHAGSWYSDDAQELESMLDKWLEDVKERYESTRAIISPHAGYVYCGSCAAYGFKQIDPTTTDRVFVLGPSHHVSFNGCALSSYDMCGTPLYDLVVDQKGTSTIDVSFAAPCLKPCAVNRELMKSGQFQLMHSSTDDAEHSIEMQLPFLAKMMRSRSTSFSVIPVLVGSLTRSKTIEYGKIFAHYLAEPRTVFIISSDFCHWGSRFRYTVWDRTLPIYSSIEDLDRCGMKAIETLDPAVFDEYLTRTGNSICGRNPISILLQTVAHFRQMSKQRVVCRFLNYAQSNRCETMQDSSVSYAAGALTID